MRSVQQITGLEMGLEHLECEHSSQAWAIDWVMLSHACLGRTANERQALP